MINTSLLLTLLLCLWAVRGEAATYYVGSAGSDSNSCATAQTIGTPKLTINSGVACLAAGDTLLVRTGTYNEGLINPSLASGTSWANTVRIANYNSETVTMRPLTNAVSGGRVVLLDGTYSYIEFDGIDMDGSLLSGTECAFWVSTNNLNNPHHIRLKNAEVIGGTIGSGAAVCLGSSNRVVSSPGGNEVQSVVIHGGGIAGSCGFACSSYGIYVAGPNNLMEDVEIYDTSGACVHIYAGSGDAANSNIVRRMNCHDVTRYGDASQLWGVLVSGDNNQIYNNLIANIDGGSVGDGIYVYTGTGTDIWNNTIYNVRVRGINLSADASTTEVRNNIVYIAGTATYTNNGTGTVATTNLFTDPTFVNAAAANYQLQATSAAIDGGTTVAGVTTDYAAVARPQGAAYDIGAYEYTASSGPTVTIQQPTTGATYTLAASPLTTLAGICADDLGVSSVTWVNDRGGSGTATGTTSWSVASITLQDGANVLTVTCTDTNSNTGTDVLTVTVPPVNRFRLKGLRAWWKWLSRHEANAMLVARYDPAY